MLEGAPLPTLDLDIVYETSSENIDRLSSALEALGALYRDPAGREIKPDSQRLAAVKVSLLKTRFGSLDVLQVVGDGLRYDQLVSRCNDYELEGLVIRSLGLPALIETKEYADRPKDHRALPFLRQLQRMKAEETEESD